MGYKVKQNVVWKKNHGKKYFKFMWSLYHKALIINIWKAKILKEVKVGCQMCDHAEQDIFTEILLLS